ncbi:hypothetical protein BDR06DRAFT_1012311 [Suillus hirtellus]|nr:hypothetical protein BDR06DRAFT_1012311 [Suillus hirtellus]
MPPALRPRSTPSARTQNKVNTMLMFRWTWKAPLLEMDLIMIPGTMSEEPMHSRRCIQKPFDDIEHPAGDLIDVNNPDVPSLPTRPRIQRVLLTLRDTLQSAFNSFGICRLYPRRPSFEPSKFIPSSLLAKSCLIVVQGTGSKANVLPPPFPFPNTTIYRLMSWMNSGSHQKLEPEVQHLVKDVLQATDFNIKHLEGFSVKRSLRELDKDEGREKITFPDDWIETDVTIDIPMKSRDEGPKTYTIPGFHYRPLVEVICAAFADVQASAFHLFPFKRLWKDPLDDHEERIFDELYSSDAWLEAQDNLHKLPKEPNCSLEHIIAGLMLFSDATHLANFGTAKAWPLYLYFGNLMKVLIAAIKDMGSCACPHCLTLKSKFGSLGLIKDMKSQMINLQVYATTKVIQACEFIYKYGNTVDGSKVEHTLGEGSWIPTMNQFVNKLGSLGSDPFRMLVIDFMHECELGTWKALFTHLIRLLYALSGGSQLVATLDSRFRQVPTFGNGTIRKFANNTSEMKRIAACDFEDILQCSIAVFEGLFPAEHDSAVQSLLYRFAQWHALVKLRIHSDSTVNFLEQTFKTLSWMLQKFRRDTCATFKTMELPKEKAARQRRLTQRSEPNATSMESSGARIKKFNLGTYKFHAMGDYVSTIWLFRMMDSFTTQMGELAHRALKVFYPLTSKLDSPAQLAKHKCRCRVLRWVAEAGDMPPPGTHSPADASPSMSSGQHHHIAITQGSPIQLFTFLQEYNGDPAVQNFIPKLKDHILFRLRKLDISYCDHTFTDEEHNTVIIPNNTIYSVHTMQVYYITYDFRREYDTINPRTHADIMVLSGELMPSHPYWYAWVLGIYHMEMWLMNRGQPTKQCLEVLWVRWLAPLRSHRSSMKYTHLPKVAFVDESDLDAFGFLDPSQEEEEEEEEEEGDYALSDEELEEGDDDGDGEDKEGWDGDVFDDLSF